MSECRTTDFLNCVPQPQEEIARKVKIIESRGKREVYRILKRAGIERNSRKWIDYSRGKRLIFSGMWINSEVYSRQIGWITDYLNL